jgi:serine protease Do
MVMEQIARSSGLADELAALADHVRSSVVVVHGHRSGTGSGVVWNDEGLVITNHHVAPGERAEIDLGKEGRFPARVKARSERHDLAALQLEQPLKSSRVRPADLGDSTRLRAGELVVAVGNPLGERNATTMGMVSRIGPGWGRPGSEESIQVAITLRPGNSGGALADVQGRVVGIPNMVVGHGQALAVPSHLVEQLLVESAEGRAVFGIRGQSVELPERVVNAYELLGTEGLLVLDTDPDSPAAQAGIIMGDIIISAQPHDGPPADPSMGVLAQLHRAPIGQPVRLTLLRGDVLRWIDATPRAG